MGRKSFPFAEVLERRLVLSALSLTYNGQAIADGDQIEIRHLHADDALTFRMVAGTDVQSEQIGESCVHVNKFTLPSSMHHQQAPLGCLPSGAARVVDVVLTSGESTSDGDQYRFAVAFENGGVEEQIDFTAIIRERVPGDTDDDFDVDFSDFLRLQALFQHEVSGGYKDADFDNSGLVDFADFLALSVNFGATLAADDGLAGEKNSLGEAVPRAFVDAFKIHQQDRLTIKAAEGVLANDVNEFGQVISQISAAIPSLKAILVEAPVAGQVTLHDDGSFDYVPPSEFIGVAEFTYVPVGTLQGVPQRVSITVLSEFQSTRQTANDDKYVASKNTVLVVDALDGVIANDNDEADPLHAALFEGPKNGTVLLDADGSFVYTPNANFKGNDTFSYVVNDQFFSSEPATVTIRVL